MKETRIITLKGMKFHTLVGILPHERQFPQPLEIDLTVELRGAGKAAGGATPLLDYRELHDLVATRLSGGGNELLEYIASDILDAVSTLADVARSSVSIRKPHVSLPGPLEFAEVTLERRGELEAND